MDAGTGRHRRPRTVVSRLPRALRSAAAGTALCVIAVGTASLALAPSAEAATGPSAACPAASLVTGSEQLAGNAPPKLRHDKILTVEDTTGSVNVLDNDGSSAGPLAVTDVTKPDHGAVSWKPTGEVTYHPDNGYVGFDGFTYSARDTAGQTSEGGTVGVRVCNVGPTSEAVSLVGTFNHPVGFN